MLKVMGNRPVGWSWGRRKIMSGLRKKNEALKKVV